MISSTAAGEAFSAGSVLAVIDDFLDDAGSVRERMLALPFYRPTGVNYPGLAASLPLELTPDPARIGALLNCIRVRLQAGVGEARLTQARDEQDRTSLVHADSSDFSAVLHLSEDQSDGIYFYRHRELAIDRISPRDPWLTFVRGIVTRDTLDFSAWEVTRTIPMRFNRLTLFDGRYFHSGPHRLIGSCARSGRLTQNLFYYRV